MIFLHKDKSHTKSTTHCLAARSNINSNRHLRINSSLSVTASVISLFTGECWEHLFPVLKKKEEVEHHVQAPFSQCQAVFKGVVITPGTFMFPWREPGPGTSIAATLQLELGEGVEEAGAVPPFLPSPWSCLVPKSIEQCVTSRANPCRVCSAASLPKLNIPAPRAAWDRQEGGCARSRKALFPFSLILLVLQASFSLDGFLTAGHVL